MERDCPDYQGLSLLKLLRQNTLDWVIYKYINVLLTALGQSKINVPTGLVSGEGSPSAS